MNQPLIAVVCLFIAAGLCAWEFWEGRSKIALALLFFIAAFILRS